MTGSTAEPPADSTADARAGGLRGWWRQLSWGARIGVVSLLVAVIGLVPSFGQWLKDDTRGAGAAPDGSATVFPPPSPASAGTSASPSATEGGQSLLTLPVTQGVARTDRPDALRDAAGYDGARYVDCPDNQKSQISQVVYRLDQRYGGVALTVGGWADGGAKDRLLLKIYVNLPQRDGTMVKEYKTFADVTANGPEKELTARVPGARDLVLELECEKPHQILVLRRATVTS